MEDVTQGQGGAVSATETTQENVAPQTDFHTEISTLKAGVESTQAKFDQLISMLSAQQQATVKPVDYAELVKNDLPGAIKLAAAETAKLEMGEVKKLLAKQEYDQRLEREFPQVNTDKTFREATLSKMKELVSNGEFRQDSPSLPYRAAQLAALSYKGKTVAQGSGGMTGEAPRSGGSSSSPAAKNPEGFDAWMGVFGNLIKDKEGMKAKYAEYKGKKGAR